MYAEFPQREAGTKFSALESRTELAARDFPAISCDSERRTHARLSAPYF